MKNTKKLSKRIIRDAENLAKFNAERRLADYVQENIMSALEQKNVIFHFGFIGLGKTSEYNYCQLHEAVKKEIINDLIKSNFSVMSELFKACQTAGIFSSYETLKEISLDSLISLLLDDFLDLELQKLTRKFLDAYFVILQNENLTKSEFGYHDFLLKTCMNPLHVKD